MSAALLLGPTFRFLRWRFWLPNGVGELVDQAVESLLTRTVDGAEGIDRAVILAFDAVHDDTGGLDQKNTHLYVTNDYAAEVVRRHPKMLFGASIHPYRKDAVAELERCIGLGAVLLKWLPIVQDFNPADERCFPLYEALAHHRMPLLSHTGGEKALPVRNLAWADPMLLLPALQRGVTVIAAHCGTRSGRGETDFVPAFLRLAREHEHLYGDTSALCLPTRSYAFASILEDETVRKKLVHGSDWPIISLPPLRIGKWKALKLLLTERNWMQRDVLAKRALGLEDDYWHRAAKLLRLPK